MKLILWWSFASLLQVSELCFCKQQQQKTLQTMLLFVACMSGLSGHNGCSFFMFLCDTVSLCYYTSLDWLLNNEPLFARFNKAIYLRQNIQDNQIISLASVILRKLKVMPFEIKASCMMISKVRTNKNAWANAMTHQTHSTNTLTI